ncbi:PSP1 C-terminal conserved region-domain-containing protein [Mucor mucedo]|uniref:PSP1 C-terminal conserved region-domain-containing protein n=1 Tax=Mucor mucedo TaxID=29922 RepID=UPI0022210D34|nr:PSP1 C-terminal conserved region-domain-containing protein [Mucor mucedo]KAI7893195.1 PSP1 C-terminal conserved region-domain-containing protein [Mucor mucedo]
MSHSINSLFDDEESSWTPFPDNNINSSRRPSLLPHPSDLRTWSFREEEKDLFSPGFHHVVAEEEAFERTRSKSSAAIMDIWNTTADEPQEDSTWRAVHYRFEQRRLSLGPTVSSLERCVCVCVCVCEIYACLINHIILEIRRHSLAGSMSSLLELESLSVRERPTSIIPVNESDLKNTDEMGKGTRLDADVLMDAVFYVVEFKGGRWDVFYSACNYKKNELVIVEADRGHDLGKISIDNISRDQLKEYYTLLKNINHNTGELNTTDGKLLYQQHEIFIKSIFRTALNDEITLLMAKSQDEAKALMVCQSKIKQKKLNMQVVEAEYQWDRRKLTFYFVAEKRVDFRELVRELFKLYKTRIWMCAVNSIKAI